MSAEQRENLEAVLRQSAFPVGSDVSEQRRLLRELMSAQPLSADVTVTAAALGAVRTAEITNDGIEPRHVVLYFHGGVYVMGDAFLAADLASQVGRRTQAKVISVDYRLARQAATADVEVTLDITAGVPHVFQTFYPVLDEAAAALDRAGQLLSAHLAGAERVAAQQRQNDHPTEEQKCEQQ